MTTTNSYPLYDVPYLVRDPNAYRMSAARHALEVRNQAVADDYFLARDKGLSAREAKRQVAEKHKMTPERADRIIRWFFEEAKKRRKYDFLIKFAPLEEHETDFRTIFAPDFKIWVYYAKIFGYDNYHDMYAAGEL